MMTEKRCAELTARWKAQELTPAEEAEVLKDGPYCAFARWVTHPIDGWRTIQCRRFGANAQAWLSPTGKECRGCKESAEFDGRPDAYERSQVEADDIAASLGAEEATAAAKLAFRKAIWGIDLLASVHARTLLTDALARATRYGLPADAALRLAQAQKLVKR